MSAQSTVQLFIIIQFIVGQPMMDLSRLWCRLPVNNRARSGVVGTLPMTVKKSSRALETSKVQHMAAQEATGVVLLLAMAFKCVVKVAAKQLENMMPGIVEWFSTELD
ncbi:hypothetical protein I7I51_00724 [Histoplasma capsulatum]|uniref:Uncharacterized protein n=1 Tax=Ajellomyces capsulatus TaxID=5037 RepID=A0A8A1MCU5_AJECA|nr:hypothetical protein I7I51_00724 [Histoplasma capsulatum]